MSLAVGEVAPRDVRPYAEVIARDVLHERPHERLPRRDGAFVDRERIVRDDRIHVDFPHDARSVAPLARALRIEGELLRAGREEARAAFGADELALRRHVQGRREVVSVRAAVRREARVHEAERVEKLRRGAERGADAWDAWTLSERESGRHVAPRAPPASCAGACKWRAIRDNGAIPPRTRCPARETTCRSPKRPRRRRSSRAECRRRCS